MELNLKSENIKYSKPVLDVNLTQEETMEMIVPDALPDILRILDTDATVMLRSKEAESGRVSVSGNINATVIYSPDGLAGVRRLELNIPFTITAPGAEITNNSKVITAMSLISIEGNMLNPRKVLVRANVLADVTCYNDSEITIASSLDDQDYADSAGIEMQYENENFCAVTSVCEKTFIVSDEFQIANPSIGDILKTNIRMSVEDAKTVGNKLIFRGDCKLEVLYVPESGGEIRKADFTTEFSQIIEADNASDDDIVDIKTMLTGQYFEIIGQNEDILSVELHAVAQCIAMSRSDITYLSDTYSTKYDINPVLDDMSVESRNRTFSVSDTFRASMETAEEVRDVVSINAHTGMPTQEIQGDKLYLKASLYVTAVYTSDDGRMLSISRRFEMEAMSEVDTRYMYKAVAAHNREVFAASSGNGIDIRMPVEFQIVETSQLRLRAITQISYDEDSPLDISGRPSLIVHRVTEADSMWMLAKRYNSSPDLINAANEIENGLVVGQQLIIPKRR